MKLSSLALFVALASAAAVQAQSPPTSTPDQQGGREAVKEACATDVQSLCAGKQGRDAMMCLRSNSDKVSAGCKDAMSKLHGPGAPPK
jgi:hypothetical protein